VAESSNGVDASLARAKENGSGGGGGGWLCAVGFSGESSTLHPAPRRDSETTGAVRGA